MSDILDRYAELVAPHAGIEIKGKANRYTAINGNMFSFVGPDGELCFRVDPRERAEFGASFDAAPVIRYNAVMKDYVAVGSDLLADRAALAHWFGRSVTYARGLKPKPTRKKK